MKYAIIIKNVSLKFRTKERTDANINIILKALSVLTSEFIASPSSIINIFKKPAYINHLCIYLHTEKNNRGPTSNNQIKIGETYNSLYTFSISESVNWVRNK